MNCPMCGHENEAGARFCSSCGAALPSVPQPTGVIPIPENPSANDTTEIAAVDSAHIPELQAGVAVLVVTRGALEGVRFTLDNRSSDDVTIGRSPEATVFLDDVTVSRKHAVLSHDNAGWTIHDAGSLNGTYVNRSLVTAALLRNNDEVQVGKYRFVFIESDK